MLYVHAGFYEEVKHFDFSDSLSFLCEQNTFTRGIFADFQT